MLTFIRILIGVYALSVNVYSFMLLKSQRDSYDEGECESAPHDGKIFTSALLGGAIGIFIATFALKYRLKSMFLMVLMPVIIVINVYVLILLFTGDFGLFPEYRITTASLSGLKAAASALL